MFTLFVTQIIGQEIPKEKFTPKNCLFEVTNIVRNSDKEKCVYSGYGITFDGRGE